MLVPTFGRDLKRLIPVGNPYSMAGKNILEILQDWILCNYYPILFQKDQEKIWVLISQEQN